MIMLVYSMTMFILCVAMLQPPTCPNARQCGVNRGESAPEVTVERRLILREHDWQEQDAGGEAALHGLPPARGQTKFVCNDKTKFVYTMKRFVMPTRTHGMSER